MTQTYLTLIPRSQRPSTYPSYSEAPVWLTLVWIVCAEEDEHCFTPIALSLEDTPLRVVILDTQRFQSQLMRQMAHRQEPSGDQHAVRPMQQPPPPVVTSVGPISPWSALSIHLEG